MTSIFPIPSSRIDHYRKFKKYRTPGSILDKAARSEFRIELQNLGITLIEDLSFDNFEVTIYFRNIEDINFYRMFGSIHEGLFSPFEMYSNFKFLVKFDVKKRLFNRWF